MGYFTKTFFPNPFSRMQKSRIIFFPNAWNEKIEKSKWSNDRISGQFLGTIPKRERRGKSLQLITKKLNFLKKLPLSAPLGCWNSLYFSNFCSNSFRESWRKIDRYIENSNRHSNNALRIRQKNVTFSKIKKKTWKKFSFNF